MRIHGATPARIRELRAAGLAADDPEDVVRLRIHNVTPEFIAGLKSRSYTGLLADDYVKMRIHGVSLAEIDELKALGYSGLGADELVKFRIHGVRPAFIRDMRGVGFTNVDEQDLVKMRIHNVSAEFVREARADGLQINSPDDAVDLAIHGRRWRRRQLTFPVPCSLHPVSVLQDVGVMLEVPGRRPRPSPGRLPACCWPCRRGRGPRHPGTRRAAAWQPAPRAAPPPRWPASAARSRTRADRRSRRSPAAASHPPRAMRSRR